MKLIEKKKYSDGRRKVYVLGKKVLSYKRKKAQEVLGAEENGKPSEYDMIFAKRFSGLNLSEKRFILEKQFRFYAGYDLNLNNPQTFNEKTQWYKLYYCHPLMKVCADKVLVRDYVKEKIGEKYLVDIIGVYDDVEKIDWDKLPDQFVLKVNHGSGQNLICKDKKQFDIAQAKAKLAEWMDPKNNHAYNYLEYAYKNIEPKIVAEKYIKQMDGNLLDYKFFCFDGKAQYVQIDLDRYTHHTRCFYDMDFKKQEFTTCYPFYTGEVEKPEAFDEMRKIAETLAHGFPFVRVDLYNLDGKVKFGEMTFYHGNGTEHFEPQEWDLKLGKLFKLPKFPYMADDATKRSVGVYYRDVFTYPDKKYNFRPSKAYPEYPFQNEISSEPNEVYDMVRENFHLMKMDEENFGTAKWNPLKEIVHPGDKVLLKPNLVLHHNLLGLGEDCLYTQPSVTAAVIDYVLIALQGKGSIIVGDAPLQECVFDTLVQESGYDQLIAYYQNKGVDIQLKDFRNVKTYVGKDGIHYTQDDSQNHKDEGLVVHLDAYSSFYGLDEERISRMRITNYDPRILQKHHSSQKHEYKVSKYILEADVIINLPKPKTHRKAGATSALKNLVGINANKEFLPHHTNLSKQEGGDAYFHKSQALQIANEWLDKMNIFTAEGKVEEAQKAKAMYYQYSDFGKAESGEIYWEGSWYGNDTIWRTLFDLNKILFHADKNGIIRANKQRRYFVVADMIVSGEKEGPLEPTPRPVGMIAMGYDPCCFDQAIVSMMGFDYRLLPSVYEIKNRKGGVCEITSGAEPLLLSNVPQWQGKSVDEIKQTCSLQFYPTNGWKKVLW